ncbi:hypothetical protein [Paenibacillus naphthalenovorans]|uniref:hypothetical protein n=1 Tax=Paenibacillus naphthalenovorans TaxID=162209 RepID=UPI0008855FEC|nr:hypothetical protein [Paenibacillus naphthalenovorans]SDJ52971.1 hypothetical protein SAMN05421868_13058 [Paenibacillus naphthalenovorans]
MNNDLYRLIPYNFEGISYALPSNSSERFKRHIKASLISYIRCEYNYENINEILDNLPIENSDEDEINYYIAQDMIIGIIENLQKIIKVLLKKINNETGILHYCIAMMRLQSTFESCLILLRNGYYIEFSPLIRLIFEQLAWAYSIFDKDQEYIKNSSVTLSIKCLNDFKKGLSKNYKRYSDEAHMNVSEISEYLITDEEKCLIGVKRRSGLKSRERFVDIVHLCELYILSLEKVIIYKELLDAELEDELVPSDGKPITIQEFIETSKLSLNMIINLYLSEENATSSVNQGWKLNYSDSI